MERNDQSDRVGLPECANSLTVEQTSFLLRSLSEQSLLGPKAESCKKRKQPSGNEEWCGGLSGGHLLFYEQGGSSDGVRGLQGGTVLKERKAKMEGS